MVLIKHNFNNSNHFFNAVMKKLKENELFFDEESVDKIKKFTKAVFEFDIQYKEQVNELGMNNVVTTCFFIFIGCESVEDVRGAFKECCYLLDALLKIFRNEELTETEIDILESHKVKHQKVTKLYSSIRKKECDLNSGFLRSLESLECKTGLYKLYNEKKELIYLGKSTTSLGSRLISSVRERNAEYISYCEIDNIADLNIYEVYLIGKLKPLLNVDCKSDSTPTLELPGLDFSEKVKVFESEVNSIE